MVTVRPRRPVPDPVDRPGSDVVIYDGHCSFCSAQVRILHRLDVTRRLAFLSLHDPMTARRYPDLTRDRLMEQMFVVTPGGKRIAGAGAVRYLTRRIPLLWIFAPFLHIPGSMPLWRWLYSQIARRRYRLAGTRCADDACPIFR